MFLELRLFGRPVLSFELTHDPAPADEDEDSARWLVHEVGDHIHVAPIDDLVGHEVDGPHAECPCGPEVEHQDTDGAGDRWLVTHHSLDGREQAEDS